MIESRRKKGQLIGTCTLIGCLPIVSCVSLAAGQDPQMDACALAYVKALEEGRVEQMRTSRVMLGYGVDPGSPDVEGAELFFTNDEGRNWVEVTLANPRANPISFDAPEDGLYGFVFVLHGAHGSMPRPKPGTEPHRWVMVDRAAPHIVTRNFMPPAPGSTNRDVRIGWLVTDVNNNLGQRPVAISYRTKSESLASTRSIARGLEASGEHVWTIPTNVSGEIVLRIEAEDRAGNRDYVETRAFDVASPIKAPTTVRVNQTVSLASSRDAASRGLANAPVRLASDTEKSQPDVVVSAFALLNESSPDEIVVEKEAAERAKKEYDLGTWHRLRGEYEIAIRRYRDALEVHPGYYQARNDLAGTLLAIGRIDEATREYERILEMDDRYAPALEGLSLVQIKKRLYRSAHATLERLLRERPNDPEAWLHFGDVCMFMGDRRGAREAWHTAAECERAVASLKSRAKRRLAIYQRDSLGAAD